MELLDLVRAMIITSIFLIFAGGTMIVDTIWNQEVVEPMRYSSGMGFIIFELVLTLVAAGLIVGVAIQFLSALLGGVFNLYGSSSGPFGLSIPGLSLFALILTIIVAAMLASFVQFIIAHMPFIVLSCVVIFILVGWLKQAIRSALFG